MRIAIAAAFASGIAATATFAQPYNDAPFAFVPEFAAQPTQSDYITHYPPAALRRNTSGIAILCCDEREDRGLDCTVSSEWPAEQGFGAASVRAAQAYRLTAQSHADLAARPGVQVRLSVRWASPVPDEAQLAEMRRINGETLEICLPPAQ
jgi:hypothetical protein